MRHTLKTATTSLENRSPLTARLLALFLLPFIASDITYASTLKTWQQLWVWPGSTVRLRGFATPAEACKPYGLSWQTGPDTANCAQGWYVSTFTENCPWGDNSGQGLSSGIKCNSSCNPPNTMSGGQCYPKDEQKGEPDPKSCAGNPINIAIGNKYQAESDYSPGDSNLGFSRSYNSLDGLWRHNYSTHLRLVSTTYIALVMADGRETFFTVSGTTVTASPTELGKLVKLTDGWRYTAKNNESFTFDTIGRLTRWISAVGLEQQLSYSGTTVTVANSLGRILTFTEDAKHQPLSLMAEGLEISYSYNANQRLSHLTRTHNGQTEQRLFHYEKPNKPNLLTGITDERGVRYATWTYDSQDRATSSEHANGAGYTQVVYNADGSSTVTNALGKKATYRFVAIGGIKRVTAIEGEPSANCPLSNSTFTYNNRGLLKTHKDNKGNLTTYDYNSRGLEIARTEASGTAQARTISTDWHPTLFLPLVVTEPDRITRYQYDDQGRQLSRTVEAR